MSDQLTHLITQAKIALRNQNFTAAELFLNKAYLLGSKNPEVLRLLGVMQAKQKNHVKALDFFKKALEISSSNPLITSNIGNVYFELRQFNRALEFYERSINQDRNYAEAHSNRGNVLQELRNFKDAIIAYDRAIAINPGDLSVYINKGNAYLEQGLLENAASCYEMAIKLKQDYYPAYWHMSLALLLSGNFHDGFKLYESRWADEYEFSFTGGKRNFSQPLWLGDEDLAGKSILLYCEQGLGDSLQFCRYVKLVADLGASVILEAPEKLAYLFNGLEGVSQLVVKGEPLPEFDFHCPMLSLPLAFKTDIDSIPASTRYLKSDPNKVEQWKERLGEQSRPRIGVVWSSTSNYKHDSKRSLSLSSFAQALPDGDYEYICLQKEIKESDKEFMRSFAKIKFYGDDLHDFSDTAALIECVDLVVSTCTSIPHLSAALGKKTWVLLSYVPDWRWLLKGEDSPWYPSVSLFRQEKLDEWSSVLDNIRGKIRSYNFNE